jgi:hypothetical protein
MAAALGALACGAGGGENEPAFESVTLVRLPAGYGGAPAGPGSTCSGLSYRDTLAVDGASQRLSFDRCGFEAPDVYTVRQGQRTLTAAELDTIEQTLARLDVGTPEWVCGADAGFITLDVRKEASTELYISASNCPGEFSAGRTTATGIGDLWTQLDELRGE